MNEYSFFRRSFVLENDVNGISYRSSRNFGIVVVYGSFDGANARAGVVVRGVLPRSV